MSILNISLNPTQLEELTFSEAVQLGLYMVQKMEKQFQEKEFISNKNEILQLHSFRVYMDWYIGFMNLFVKSQDTDCILRMKHICVSSMDSPQSIDLHESFFDHNNLVNELPIHKTWIITSRILRAICDYAVTLSTKTQNEQVVKDWCLVAEDKIRLMECLMIQKLLHEPINDKEINFYYIMVEREKLVKEAENLP